MPFTPSHAAAALLFTRTPLFPAALVAGSVAPDLPYYLPLPIDRELTHEPVGVITIDLLLGLTAFLLWQLAFRTPVLDLSPAWLRERMPQRSPLGWHVSGRVWPVTLLLLVASLVVGSITHLVWDEFTHPGWLVDHVTVLRLQAGPLLVHKWLQHGSTVFGLAVIAVWALRWVARTPVVPTAGVVHNRIRLGSWIAVAAVFVVSALVAWAVALVAQVTAGIPFAPLDPGVVFLTARICVASALASAILICVGWYFYRARASVASTPTTFQNSGNRGDMP